MSISVNNSGNNPATYVAIPTVTMDATYKYDGTAKGPTIVSRDTDNTTVSGTTSATEVGEYTMTISLNDPSYMAWSDLTTTPKTYTYVITDASVYGVYWDGTSSPAMSRTDDAELFTDPVPALSNGSGSSPFDTCMPWSGMERVTDADAGVLVRIPKFWYKWTRTGSTMKLQISDKALSGYHTSPAHADRGDGNGERDYVYVGAYHCSSSDYKSTTGVTPKASITRANFRTNIHNLGTDIWQWDYAMAWTIRMLYLVEYANWNSQNVIGYGCTSSGAVENSGACDAMTYHTGTDQASRTSYGRTRYRWIEDLWGNVYDWVDGIYFSGTTIYGINTPSAFSDTTGGTEIGTRGSASSYITEWTTPEAEGFEYALYPSNSSGGGSSTYICDYCYYNASGVVLRVGGSYSQSQSHGLFCSYGSYAASPTATNTGSRLQKLP